MRSLCFLTLVILFAAPASAQSRFFASCVTSAQGADARTREEAEAICQCAVDRATQGHGVAPDLLDRYVDVMASAATPDIGGDQAVMRRVVRLVRESTRTCALDPSAGRRAGAPALPSGAVPVGGEPAPAPRGTTGIRTGDGTGPVRAEQSGKGGAVRIVG